MKEAPVETSRVGSLPLFLRVPPLVTVSLFALVVAVLAVGLPGLRGLRSLGIDNSLPVWLENGDEAAEQYQRFTKAFGSDEILMIGFFGKSIFEDNVLNAAADTARRLEALPGITDHGLSGPPLVWGRKYKRARHSAFLKEIRSPRYRNLFVGEGGQSMAVLARVEPGGGKERNRQLVAEVRSALAAFRETAGRRWGITTALAGSPAVNAALDQGSSRDAALFFPCVIALAAAVLLFLFQDLLSVILLMVSAGSAVAIILGLFAASGRDLNMVTVVLPSLVWVLGLSHAIHLGTQVRARRTAGDSMDLALPRVVRELALPCALAAGTTAAGFLTLCFSGIRAVSELGVSAAAGMGCGLLCSFFLLPALCRLFPSVFPTDRTQGAPDKAGQLFPGAQHPRWTAAFSLVLLALCALGAARVQAESDILAFFPKNTPIVRDSDRIGRELTGLYTLEVDARLPAQGLSLPVTKALDNFGKELEKRPHVARVQSLASQLFESLPFPELLENGPGADVLSGYFDQTLENLERAWPEGIHHSLSQDHTRMRVSVFIRSIPSEDFYAVLDAAKEAAGRILEPAGIKATLTGAVPLLVDLQAKLVSGAVKSFLLAFGAISLILIISVRDARLCAAAFLPNLAPIAAVLGAMGTFGIRLDAATMMVASVAFGIGVDDTLHVLFRFRSEFAKDGQVPAALARTRATAGEGVLLTSVVNACGFAVLGFAAFKPLAWFGLLSALALLVALAGDFILLPASILIINTKGNQKA